MRGAEAASVDITNEPNAQSRWTSEQGGAGNALINAKFSMHRKLRYMTKPQPLCT